MKSFVSTRLVCRRVADVGATSTGGCAGADAMLGAGAAAVVPVVPVVCVCVAGVAGFVTAGLGGLKYSGSTFGAAQAHSQRKPIEIRTAVKIRFSISRDGVRSEEHTSELQSRGHLVC